MFHNGSYYLFFKGSTLDLWIRVIELNPVECDFDLTSFRPRSRKSVLMTLNPTLHNYLIWILSLSSSTNFQFLARFNLSGDSSLMANLDRCGKILGVIELERPFQENSFRSNTCNSMSRHFEYS